MRISDWSSDVCSSDLLLMSGLTAQQALQRTIEHREIFHDEMVGLMRQIMRGDVSPLMTSAILTGLRVKKETVGEIAAGAQVLREQIGRESCRGRGCQYGVFGVWA